MDLAALALTFGAIFVVELPDKTFLATLVLATKYRPLLVWIGVGLAFTVQTTIAVGLGQVATLLPQDLVRGGAAVLFVIGAIVLTREARRQKARSDAAGVASDGDDADVVTAGPADGWRAVLASFLVLFAAEFGDLSQLLTLSLVARYEAPVSVFLGALAALLTVSALAVIVGRSLLRVVSLHVLHYVGAAVCVLLAGLTVLELTR